MSETTRGFGELAAATEMTGAAVIVRQAGSNKRAPLSVVQTWIEGLDLGGGEGGGGTGPEGQVLTADIGTTADTLGTILTFTVEANKVYRLNGGLLYRVSNLTDGIKMGIGGDAGVQSITMRCTSFDSSGNPVTKMVKAKATAMEFATSLYAGDNNLMTIDGTIYTTSSGTILIQSCSNVEFAYSAIQKGSGATLQVVGDIPV